MQDNPIVESALLPLVKQLKNIQIFLKREYKRLVLLPALPPIYQTFCDNYYILDNKLKLCMKRKTKVKIVLANGSKPQLGLEIFLLCSGNKLPNFEEIAARFLEIQKERYLSNDEFDLLEWSFLYVLNFEAARILRDKIKDESELLRLISLLSKSDLLPTKQLIRRLNPLEVLYSAESADIYAHMDEFTRQIYRDRTAFIAKKQGNNELETARNFLLLAEKAAANGLSVSDCHVGKYIFSAYEKYKKRISERGYRGILALLPLISAIIVAVLLDTWWIAPLIYLPLWAALKPLTEFFVTLGLEASYLPRMEFSEHLSLEAPTLTVVSTILSSPKDALSAREKLKRLYFSNMAVGVKFCILCDFMPSTLPSLQEDKAISASLQRVIEGLNAEFGDVFISIIRQRTFSKTEGKFIGFERKRGAIEQLVSYISEDCDANFTVFGAKNFLKTVKNLVVLDYDTEPLMDTIQQLIAVAAHPMNVPKITKGRIENGYGILAPRVTTQLASSLKTPFSRLVGGIGSSSAYDFLCANLYQDLFGEGIFAGKGLINVAAFHKLCVKKFPEEQVLSHDILEGSLLRTAFVGDVEFSDSFPATAASYFKRLNRWLRGDVQNADFLTPKHQLRLSAMNRFKLFDNLRRAASPVNIFLIICIFGFIKTPIAPWIFAIALAATAMPFLLGIVSSICSNGCFSLSRRYYSNLLSETSSLLIQLFYEIMLLPLLAVTSANASFTAAWRLKISKRHLLQWTTAAQADKKIYTKWNQYAYLLPAEILSILLIFSPFPFIRLLGIVWGFLPLLIFISDKPYNRHRLRLTTQKSAALSADLAAMWQFYEDYATEREHFLPPDNVQFSPVLRICHRTSPTNIGMFLLSVLAARDFDLIDSAGLVTRVSATLSSIEKMKKYHGNLYNWYETESLELSANPYVSSVDSGNFVCCLTALRMGLSEYLGEDDGISGLIARLGKVVDDTRLEVFFNTAKGLFSIGVDPATDILSENHYDMLMSEARMLSYFAVAKRLVPKKHWKTLARTMKKSGRYYGCVSFSGTMFEFFMPELLLKSEYGSLAYESLRFCVYCQNKRAAKEKLPSGISESGYYAFDSLLNYQYKANGVQNIGIKRGLDKEYIVSPYSTYLSMQMDSEGGFQNLKLLKKYGTTGIYGHYEAIDFSENHWASLAAGSGAIIKSYMAHHVGMSILAIANILEGGIMQKRFLCDNYMQSAHELLEEKVISGSVVYDDFGAGERNIHAKSSDDCNEFFEHFSVSQPNVKLLTNGDYTLAVTDLGACIALYQGQDVYARTSDLLRRPAGCYFAIKNDSVTTPLSYLPCYENSAEQSVEFSENSVSFYSNSKTLELGMNVFLHSNIPCEFRQFAVKNVLSAAVTVDLLCYIEPILINHMDFEAHPAFQKLFINIEYDKSNNILIARRRDRNGNQEQFLAVGFCSGIDFCYNLSREAVLTSPHGTPSAFWKADELCQSGGHLPDPCIFLKTAIDLQGKEQKNVTLFLCSALSHEELLQSVSRVRLDSTCSAVPLQAASSSIAARLAAAILPQILFNKRDGNEVDRAITKNTLPSSALRQLSISGDLPIVLLELFSHNDCEKLIGYYKCYELLKRSRLEVDLVIIFAEKTEGGMILPAVQKLLHQLGGEVFLGQSGGVHLVNFSHHAGNAKELKTLLFAAAAHVMPRAMNRIGSAAMKFLPVKIYPVGCEAPQKNHCTFGSGTVTLSPKTDLPWCQILANPVFGTLVSNNALGCTYAINSRENMLTPWFNDTSTDNRGEMLLLKCGEGFFDLCLGAATQFSAGSAIFCGKNDYFSSAVTVSVSKTGCCKKISVAIKWKASPQPCNICYYTEPVLGASRKNSRLIIAENVDNALLLHNPNNAEISGFMALSSGVKCTLSTNRESVLSGKAEGGALSSQHNPCAALITPLKAITAVDFFLSFARTKKAALAMPKLFDSSKRTRENAISIQTPDRKLNAIFNDWLCEQALVARIYARTAFYQNSGAWSFREQLQDCCAVLLADSVIAKRQICRACTAQFPEGDVLHWWHKMPNSIMRGVRTRCSDDLLWLPYAVCEYVEKTAESAILGLQIAYCEGEKLSLEQKENYMPVKKSELTESVYTHCKRAIERARKFGTHGLLLMGGGDWNDGYNGVEENGAGESVWLTEFYILVLRRFSALSQLVSDKDVSEDYLSLAAELEENVKRHCWDGEWYLRAFSDSKAPLGSAKSAECRIDSLPQSFAALSLHSDADRVKIALDSAAKELVDREHGIIRNFSPAFSGADRAAGYVSHYPEGIRENGGQYTHAAIWLAIALLESGENDRGYELLEMLNPISKYQSKQLGSAYKTEPYYLAADVYTGGQCYGRGDRSIYTGAAAWYYRAVFEWLLGINIGGDLRLSPRIPSHWKGFSVSLNYKKTAISIDVIHGNDRGVFDNGVRCESIPFDGKKHAVHIVI